MTKTLAININCPSETSRSLYEVRLGGIGYTTNYPTAVILYLYCAVKIPLDRYSPKPVYLQIRDRLSRLIKSRTLQPGERLPSVRSLAESVQVNKMTVVEAYSVLEADGLISARRGSGYFVNSAVTPAAKSGATFAPTQEVIILEQQEVSGFDLYTASRQAQKQEGVIDFSSGFSRSGGLEDLQRIARRAVGQATDTLFDYDLPQGQLTLRRQIAQMLVLRGLEVSPEHIIITNGSMQGLSLTIHYHVQPGDWVIVELLMVVRLFWRETESGAAARTTKASDSLR